MENYNKERSSTTHQILDEDEEKKMDKFYAIIRGFNDARHYYQRSLSFLNHDHHNKHHKNMMVSCDNNKKITSHHHHHTTTWMPSFKREDFRDAHHHHNHDDDDDEQEDDDDDDKDFDNNSKKLISKLKKRKIYDENDGEITKATQLKNQRSYDEGLNLDLNLAL